MRFHPNPKMNTIYGASMDGKIRCWDLNTSQLSATLEGHFSVVTGLTFFTGLNQAVSYVERSSLFISYFTLKNVIIYTSRLFLDPVATKFSFCGIWLQIHPLKSSQRTNVSNHWSKFLLAKSFLYST